MLTLDIAIITHKPEGMVRLAANELPRMENVRYVISWQHHEDAPVPEQLLRDDVTVHRFEGTGLSANRNNSFEHCTSDIVLVADDDLTFIPEGIQALLKVYEDNPEYDFVSFRSVHESGVTYPSAACRLRPVFPKGYFVASFELSFRRATAGGLRCCAELGLGAPRMHGGEDEMLLQSAIRRGLNCWFVPVTVCVHDHPSTGTKARLSNGNIRAAGCIIAMCYGPSALLRVPLKAWRISRNGQASLGRALFYAIQGAIESRALRRRNRLTLW